MSTLFAMFYIGSTFLTSYGSSKLEFSRTMILGFGMIAALVLALVTAAAAILSDRIGRRRVIAGVLRRSVHLVAAAVPAARHRIAHRLPDRCHVTLSLYGVANGPAGALLPEMFQSRYRYTGAGLSYNLGGIIGGAIPPILAAQIVANYSSIWVGVLLAGLSAVSLACTLALPETKNNDLNDASVNAGHPDLRSRLRLPHLSGRPR